MKVRDAMMPDIETVGSNETIRTVAELMADLGVSTLPVSESAIWLGLSPPERSRSGLLPKP